MISDEPMSTGEETTTPVEDTTGTTPETDKTSGGEGLEKEE